MPEFLIQVEVEHPGGPRLEGASEAVIKGSQRQLDAVATMTRQAGTALRGAFLELAPSSGSVEFSLSFEGEAGLPVLAKGKATANITVTMEWQGEQ